jgi:hypothetical protein
MVDPKVKKDAKKLGHYSIRGHYQGQKFWKSDVPAWGYTVNFPLIFSFYLKGKIFSENLKNFLGSMVS